MGSTLVQTTIRDQKVFVKLEAEDSKFMNCHRCGTRLGAPVSKHRIELKDLPLRGFDTVLRLFRRKGYCVTCDKVRSETIPFMAKESPHYTQEYTWYLGQMCEFSPVSRVADFNDEDNMTVRRIDLERMRRMLRCYKIPEITHLAVDEVYARRRKKGDENDDRDERFCTVITDLRTRRVIWVSQSRKKQALDEFFEIIGTESCQRIVVVALDQHEGYAASVRQYCRNAKIVWDKFHLVQNFEVAANEVRKKLHRWLNSKDPVVKLTQPRYRFNFLKRASSRTKEEQDHISSVLAHNQDFAKLEIIKERMLTFFDSANAEEARDVFNQIGTWIKEIACDPAPERGMQALAFSDLLNWWNNLNAGWDTLKNYFEWRVTSAVAEGINNVIKTLKRRSYGFRNMEYFRLKIMQICGYLNSQFIKYPELLGN
jgi:transposase